MGVASSSAKAALLAQAAEVINGRGAAGYDAEELARHAE
jgi:hypothetical protein